PRRASSVSLILTPGLIQSERRSNRAGAKLADLPTRETDRCKRTLGEALAWRLW
ncbi:hypothetical protein EDB83DRAFT_2204432, partial [Lactarius deliciosus]